jgi:hypothetical protein
MAALDRAFAIVGCERDVELAETQLPAFSLDTAKWLFK